MESYYRNKIKVFSLKDLCLELASRWKLVLVCMIIASVLFAGLRYLSAMKSYKDAVTRANEEQAEAVDKNPEKDIEEILSSLGDADMHAVQETLYLGKLISSQREYFDNSLLMDIDPEKETVLSLLYIIKNADDKEQPIVSGYKDLLLSEEMIEAIKAESSISADNEYIRELISFDNSLETTDELEVSIDTSDKDSLKIVIIVPVGADAEQIKNSISQAMLRCKKQLVQSIGNHDLEEVSADTLQICDRKTLQIQQKTVKGILDNKNLLTTQERSLTEAQRGAYTTISALQNGVQEPRQHADQIPKPVISKKSLLYGAVAGLMLYIFVFMLLFLFRDRINTPDDAISVTDGRLIGQIYRKSNSPFRWLLSSDFVNKIRYKTMLNSDIQISKTISSIEALCRHEGAENVAIASFSMTDSEDIDIMNRIADAVGEKGISMSVIDPSDNEAFDENKMNDIDAAVIVLKGEVAQKQSVGNWLELCRWYNVNNVGTVYVKEI